MTVGDDGRQSPQIMCVGWGHEALPAAVLGIVDDGQEASADVPYCAECAHALIEAGEYRVTTVLDPIALGTVPCPACGGTGRLSRRHDRLPPRDEAEVTIREVSDLVTAFDDVPGADLTPLFYAHAFWELRLAVDALLTLLTRAAPRSTERAPGDGQTGPGDRQPDEPSASGDPNGGAGCP